MKRWLTILLVGVAWCRGARGADLPPADPYQVKAQYLALFPKFVTWPTNAFPTPTAPLTIGVIGDDPFGEALDLAAQVQTFNGRAIVVKRFQEPQDLEPCQVVFVRLASRRQGQVLEKLRSAGVLTVGESGDFLEQGGMIRFLLVDGKVRFEINAAAAVKAGLRIDSRLLGAAVSGKARSEERSR